MRILLGVSLLMVMLAGACAADRRALFTVPTFAELPPDVKVLNEKTEDGVVLTELTFAGAPFAGAPTKIYGFYARPEKAGTYPGVVQLHGAGLGVLGSSAAVYYAKNGFCCLSIDWCGPAKERKEPRKPPYSEFESTGNMAAPRPGEENKPWPQVWKSSPPETNGITNGVRFVKRAFLFLRNRPEVDADKLFLSGMSAGAHLSLLVLGNEPTIKGAAVKYGCAFIRDLPGIFGGYFGPITLAPRDEQDAWLSVLEPKHGLPDYRANVLLLSGTDDIFFWMPLVLQTYRGIPTPKRLLMLPNDNHSQVGNEVTPLAYFRSVLGEAPAWPTVEIPAATVQGDTLTLTAKADAAAGIKSVTFWTKRMPTAIFRWGTGDKDKPETQVRWTELPATLQDGLWRATLPAPVKDEQLVAYAMVEDANGNKVSSETVEAPAYLRWRGRTPYQPWEQVMKFTDFKRAELSDPARLDEVKRVGHPGATVKPNDPFRPVTGWFEYECWVPRAGWYELVVPNGGGVEYFVDDAYAYSVQPNNIVDHFYLEAGLRHRIRIQKYHWTGFPPIGSLTMRAVPPERLAAQFRVTVSDGRTLLRKGEPLKLQVLAAELEQPITLTLTVRDEKKALALEQEVALKDWPGDMTHNVELRVPHAGTFTLEYGVNGKPADTQIQRPLAFQVVDVTPAPKAGGDLPRTLIKEIDCATTAPDYAIGETRVINKPFGAYRESGDKGWLQHMNSTDPSWFAYAVTVPAAQQLYAVEVDYPDDAFRTYCIAVREANPDAYPTAGGVDSGGEFSLTNAMQTHTLLHWARTTDLRVLIIPALDGRRAAAAKIRVYQVQGDLPLLAAPQQGGRSFGNWYEEGSNFKAMYGAPNQNMPGLLTAADRWARTIAHVGGDTLWMTMVVYQFGLYPTKYNTNFGGPYSQDLVRAVMMHCEKYGMHFIGEFHPEARELDWPLNADPARLHRATNRNGAIKAKSTEPLYNPLWPKNQDWYLGMIGEFVDRYKDSPALHGVSLRLMGWVNPGLNNFHSLEWGYDDYTIGLFEKETGVKIDVDPGDVGRFRKRYDWLMAHAREKWIDWRCVKMEELYRKIATRVQQARPDLKVYSDYFLDLADPREAGIDPKRLQAIPGVVLVGGAPYGRRFGNEMEAQKYRDLLIDPAQLTQLAAPDGRAAFLHGAGYFEATEVVATPEDLGFPKGTKRTWMSGVVNPAGRHSLERWALALAETDTAFIADGGNAYTVGQPVLREFMGAYRALPALPFTARKDARDPVAVWSGAVKGYAGFTDGLYFYAVNRERYPVTVTIALNGATAVTALGSTPAAAVKQGSVTFTLKPYALQSFRAATGAAITKVTLQVPEEDRRHAESLVTFLEGLAAEAKDGKLGTLSPEQGALLTKSAAEGRAALKAGHFWRARTLAESVPLRAIYARCSRQPANLREVGAPIAPAGALLPADLQQRLQQGKAEIAASETQIPAWVGDQLLVSRDATLTFTLDIPVDALQSVEIGRVAGGEFGTLEVTLNGMPMGVVDDRNTRLHGVVQYAPKLVSVRKGPATLTLTRRGGQAIALRYLTVTPMYTDITADKWMAVGPFKVDKPEDADIYQCIDAAMRAPKWQTPEQQRNFAAPIDLNGKTAQWVRMTGHGDFINFGERYDAYLGTVSYAVTHIYAPRACQVRLAYGMDYWIKIWLNDTLIQDVAPHGGAPFKGQFSLETALKPGWNELLVKVASGSGGNGFWIAISDPGDLRFSPTPGT